MIDNRVWMGRGMLIWVVTAVVVAVLPVAMMNKGSNK